VTEEAFTSVPPLGWAGQCVYDRNRDCPHTIDLKRQGVRLFGDAARIGALRGGVRAANPAERLRACAPARRSLADQRPTPPRFIGSNDSPHGD
jgi:CBS domain-containing protein